MKIIVDMNLSPLWIRYLQERGFEAQHWSAVGKPNDPDTVIFDWAKKNQAIVFTNDLDFGAILASSQADAPSVFQVRTQDLMPASIGQIVVSGLQRFSSELNAGALVTLDLNRTKVRILPI
jgi:predicted nuclease of predicted toxin-antitoxin system